MLIGETYASDEVYKDSKRKKTYPEGRKHKRRVAICITKLANGEILNPCRHRGGDISTADLPMH